MQAAWDDHACLDSLNNLLNSISPWNDCQLFPAQESHSSAWSEAFPSPRLETSSALMGSILQSPTELVPKSSKAQNADAAKLSMSWGSIASAVLKMQGVSLDILPSTASSKDYNLALISPLPWSLSAWNMIEGGQMYWIRNPWYRGLSLVWDATVVDNMVAESEVKYPTPTPIPSET